MQPPLDPIVLCSESIDTPDGLRAFKARFHECMCMLEPVDDTSGTRYSGTSVWYDLTRSYESKPKHGYYTVLIPRLIMPPKCPHWCTARLVVQLSNTEYVTSLYTVSEFVPPVGKPPCKATMSLEDIRPVRRPAEPDTTPWYLRTLDLDWLGAVANEFRAVFLHAPAGESAPFQDKPEFI